MSIRFIDGFDHYATADLTKKWNSGAIQGINTSGRRSSGAVLINPATQSIVKTLDAQPTWIVGVAVQLSTGITSAIQIIRIVDAATLQCDVRINPDLTLSVTRAGVAVTGGTSTLALSLNTYYYVEFKVTIADAITANSCKVRVNGVDVITVATGQDLKATANASANQISLGGGSGTGAANTLFDDLYVCDGTGTTNNDFLGDCRVDTLLPNADGTYSQFTPSTGTTHYTLVDEATPNTTDYNDGLTVGNRDSYAMANLAALTSQTVYGVQVNAAMLKDDAGIKSAATMLRSGGVNGDGASATLSLTQTIVSQVFEKDPNGAIAWTEASINAAEAGVVVTA